MQPVVYALAPPPPDRTLIDTLERSGIDVHCMGGRGARDSLSVLNQLTHHLRRQQPHLLQTFLFHANLLGRLAAWRAGVPCIVSGIRVAERRHRWHLRLDRWTSRLVQRHVCVSRAVADFSIRQAGLPAERVVVIPNGVDVTRFDGAEPADLPALGLSAGRRAITYVGRFDEQKRVDWLLALAPTLLERLPQHDLLLVGDGPQRNALVQQIGGGPHSARIHFAGPRDDVPAILKASDLLVLPSAWEGMPNVVLEAMACRLPVVATEVEGVRELLGPCADEQTAPIDRPDLFVERCVAILSHPRQATALGEANRQRIEAEFTVQRMVTSYAALYRELLAR